jgi:hypothetical protein
MDQWVAAFGGVGQWEDGDCKEREETGGRVNLISRRTLQFDFRLGERKTKGGLFYGLKCFPDVCVSFSLIQIDKGKIGALKHHRHVN